MKTSNVKLGKQIQIKNYLIKTWWCIGNQQKSMKNNTEYEIGKVIVRMSNLTLWKYSNHSVEPRHKFRVSIVSYDDKTLFKKDVIVRGCSMFETRENAQICFNIVMKQMNKNIIPQSSYEGDKFTKFVNVLEEKMNNFVKEMDNSCSPLF